MPNLINPRTGQPVTPQARRLSDNEIVGALTSLDAKVQNVYQNMFHISLMMDFMLEKLAVRQDVDGTPILVIDAKEFTEFASKKQEEIKAQVEDMQHKQLESIKQPGGVEVKLDE